MAQKTMMTPDEAYEKIKAKLSSIDKTYPNGCKNLFTWPFDIDDVRALLEGYKAEQPRVMTLREVQCYHDCPVLWVETYGNDDWRDTNQIINFYAHPDSEKSKQYGISWRCWTRRPTSEQSLTTPWESGPKPGVEVQS